jgi:hypothetical protein
MVGILRGCYICDMLVIHNPDFRTKEEVETPFIFKVITKNILLVRYMFRSRDSSVGIRAGRLGGREFESR